MVDINNREILFALQSLQHPALKYHINKKIFFQAAGHYGEHLIVSCVRVPATCSDLQYLIFLCCFIPSHNEQIQLLVTVRQQLQGDHVAVTPLTA